MENTESSMGAPQIFKAEYEMRIFCNLPPALKNNVVNFDEQKISFEEIDPFSLVCVQISDNPGIKPFIIQSGKTSFDLFSDLAEKRGLSIENLHNAFQEKFSSN